MAKICFLGNTTRCQMFGCVVQTVNKTVIIDGGTPDDYPQLLKMIKKKANGHVDAWFFTHPHHDHIGSFLEICKNNPEIEIDRVLFNFPSIELLEKYGVRSQYEMELWMGFYELIKTRFCNSCQCIKAQDVFDFDEITVNVLRVFNDEITCDFVNNSSTVYRIDSPNKRILILGDLSIEGGEELMKNCSAENLYANYTQMAHHGQNGVSEEFYQYIKPQRCFWATPEWLWNNDDGGGFNSGPWATVQTRKWMEKLGVTEHLVEKDGITKIVF